MEARRKCSSIRNQNHPERSQRLAANSQVTAFVVSTHTDHQIVLAAHDQDPQRTVRLVKCPGSDWVLMTTLPDSQIYTPQKLADLYHQRWSIEEMYKQSKLVLKVENFHAKNLNGVRQELYASFYLADPRPTDVE